MKSNFSQIYLLNNIGRQGYTTQMLSIVLIGVSLSMDAFAISVSSGISIPGLRPFYALRSSFFFGLFQFIMPVAGWFLGSTFAGYIDAFDHWVVFALLAFIGGKMAFESLRSKAGDDKAGEAGASKPESGGGAIRPSGPFVEQNDINGPASQRGGDIRNMGTLLTLSAATSIDALAVGVSFSLLKQGIWLNAGIIGAVTLLICLAGFEFGRRLGRLFEKWAGLAGGLMLIGIGTKILIEHLIAG